MITPMCGLCEGEDDGWAEMDDDHIPAEVGELMEREPKDIVGADDDDVVQPGKPLPEPYEAIVKEQTIHDLAHLPHRCWRKH